MKLTLIGYMGSGKTSIGNKLNFFLKLNFYDLDFYIIKNQNKSINFLFKKEGEIKFRKIENFYLKYFLNKKKSYILSVGGGTPCYKNNIELMNNFSKTIYLKTNSFFIIKRLFNQRFNRPLISKFSISELYSYIKININKRFHFYEKCKKKINTKNKSIIELVWEIYYSLC